MLKQFPSDFSAEFPTRERCHIVELMNDPDISDVSIARCRVEPGVTTELHSLKNTQETYVVIQGRGIMDDGKSAKKPVKVMDCILIPAGHPQRIYNDGLEDLIFLAICTGRFVEMAYSPHEGPDSEPAVYP